MKRVVHIAFLLLLISHPFSRAGEYRGKVDKMEAVFTLDWKNDGTVSGYYSYPARKGITYTLTGNNPAEGELNLEEYTNGILTARCRLTKVITDTAITWKGEMHNTDGRSFPMHFTRTREAAPAPAPPIPDPLEGNRYTGHVGKLGAVYHLQWLEDGVVSGTYSYPDRPGVTYRLVGNNPREGELFLAEYTGDRLTARCNLRKRLTEGTIRWEGEMKNTDGRRFAMALSRSREAAPPPPSTLIYEAKRKEILSKIPSEVSWQDFPKASQPVEMVPLFLDGAEYYVGLVRDYHSSEDGIEMTFDVGEWGDDDTVNYIGTTIHFRMARSLPIPPEEIEGRRIGIQFGPDGKLTDVELHGIAISHVRKSNTERVEIRGVLHTDKLADLYDVNEARIRAIIENAPKIELIPDKLALGVGPGEDVFFRSIRLTPEFGIVVQLTGAGPGMLELESLGLDSTAPENPWVFIGNSETKIEVPPIQRTGEAG